MASGDARPIPRKNVAFRVTFPIYDADGDLVAGAAGLDSEISGDGGTFADCTNEATEIATNSGVYYLDLAQAEMNYDTVAIIVKTSTSGAKTTVIVMYPEEVGDVRADVVQISGDATAADNLEAYCDGTTPIPANATQISGDGTAADNLEAACDGGTYNVGGGAIVASSVTTKTGYALTTDYPLKTDLSDVADVWTQTTRTITGGTVTVSSGTITAAGTAVQAEFADVLLDRNLGTGSDSGGRTVRNALRPLVNKVEAGGTVYKEDDSTPAWTFTTTTDAGADPITVIDPA